ncbi:MAG: 3-deoxy-D-manno-octulosonic acid transferase [Bacteroidetes bacterium]|nr:3-deoxy-D-manno-octulosonic acid transferase [Bacteroidota bacterium]
MPLLYDLGIGAYQAGIRVAAAWNPKAAAWVEGRKELWKRLESVALRLQGCLWMHCASVGEFEQGRPVLEAIKAQRPELPVLLTFFSPSGYEARKHEPLATHVEYLPPDSRAHAERLLTLVNPSAAVFVKYEFWYHHLHALQRRKVPAFLVSALFRDDQPFFRWYGGAWRSMLGCFKQIFTQDEASLKLLTDIGVKHAAVGGDTRFDRVAAIAAANEELPLAGAFAGNGPVLVCGSTWPQDEEVIAEALRAMANAAPKCIAVPHELHEAQLAAIERDFPKPLARWSELEKSPVHSVEAMLGAMPQGTLLVDRMGLLARLYRYGRLAYVGGGFTDGIHSVLEAAAWGVPVIVGPRHKKFPEVQGLIEAGAGQEVRTVAELITALKRWLNDPQAVGKASEAASAYVAARAGGAARVAEVIVRVL